MPMPRENYSSTPAFLCFAHKFPCSEFNKSVMLVAVCNSIERHLMFHVHKENLTQIKQIHVDTATVQVYYNTFPLIILRVKSMDKPQNIENRQ